MGSKDDYNKGQDAFVKATNVCHSCGSSKLELGVGALIHCKNCGATQNPNKHHH